MGSIGDQFLPEDLLIDILSRLPVKSLLRFKRVCKNWYYLIQSHNFISNHNNHPNNRTHILLYNVPTYYLPIFFEPASKFTLFSDETLSNPMLKHFLNPLLTYGRRCRLYNIMGPVNGLFLMDFYDHWAYPDLLALWNPAIEEFCELTLPTLNHPPPNGYWSTNIQDDGFRLGFGLDPLTNDHKLVWIQFFKNYTIPESPASKVVVSLYSLNNDSWKELDTDLAASLNGICSSKFTTYMNGAYYWLSRTGPTVVLFDMSKEVFREVEAPPCFNQDSKSIPAHFDLMCCDDESIPCLVVVDWMINSVDVWVMKGEGCWTKHFTVELAGDIFFPLVLCYPRGFLKNGKVLCQDKRSYGQLFSYNVNNREIQKVEIRESHFLVVNYKESLASIRRGRKQRRLGKILR